MAKQPEKTVERVVTGNKPFLYRNPESGERSRVAPGKKITVRQSTAEHHKRVLQDPEVARARMAAAQKEKELREEADKATQAAKNGTDAPSQGNNQSSKQKGSHRWLRE